MHTDSRVRRKNRTPDLVDRKILSALSRNGRLTIGELAEIAGLSASPCWSRVKQLEESGAIERYAAILNAAALGLRDVVFIEITLDKHDEKVLDNFGEALARIPQVLEAHLVTGDYDYLVKVVIADTADYERFLREKLYRIPGIRHSRSTFSLRALKHEISVDPLALL